MGPHLARFLRRSCAYENSVVAPEYSLRAPGSMLRQSERWGEATGERAGSLFRALGLSGF